MGSLVRNDAGVSIDEKAAGRHDVACFAVEQSDRANVSRQFCLAEREHFFRRADTLEKGGGRFVDAAVGRLRGEDDGNKQRVGIVPD